MWMVLLRHDANQITDHRHCGRAMDQSDMPGARRHPKIEPAREGRGARNDRDCLGRGSAASVLRMRMTALQMNSEKNLLPIAENQTLCCRGNDATECPGRAPMLKLPARAMSCLMNELCGQTALIAAPILAHPAATDKGAGNTRLAKSRQVSRLGEGAPDRA